MGENEQTGDDEWQRNWTARQTALGAVLGLPANTVLHAPVPFQLGGTADVLPFPNYLPGMTYVTAELSGEDTGQRPNSIGNYELMICAKRELPKAADLISNLATYTCDNVLETGETMDIGTWFEDTTMRAVLFAHPKEQPVHFKFLGQRYGLLLCIGITADELAFKKANGSDQLLSILKTNGIFPYTIPDRPSVLLPPQRSFLRGIFGD
jgi:hypothetical protein